jgi:nicotinate phosphoribosyltransferase
MVGTSNVMLAREFNLKPIGTMAHQFIQGISVLCSMNRANHYAMEKWMEVYDNSLGTILTDTFGMDAFLKDFNGKFLNLFQSVRQDSGSPFVFVDKIIGHYKKFGINPLEKTIIFSDSLNPEKAVEIFDYCQGKIKCSFGIGTNLTADVGIKPLNMVIKLWEVNGTKVAKLSDEPGKETGDPEAIKLYKAIYGR